MAGRTFEALARTLLRNLRGGRTAAEASRRAGLASNPWARWERGERWPTLGTVLALAAKLGVDVGRAIAEFEPRAAAAYDPARPDRVSAWLGALAAGARVEVAERTGWSRYALGRVLRGQAAGRLPVALQIVDAATGRAADLVELLSEPTSLRDRRAARDRALAWAASHPWGPPVAALLRTVPPEVDPVPIVADRLRLDAASAAAEVAAAREHGPLLPDVPLLESDLRPLRRHWGTVLADRAVSPPPDDRVEFEALAVSRADLARIRALQAEFLARVRAIAAECRQPEVAGELVVAWLGWS